MASFNVVILFSFLIKLSPNEPLIVVKGNPEEDFKICFFKNGFSDITTFTNSKRPVKT